MRMAKRRITRRVGFEKCLIPWKELNMLYIFSISKANKTSVTISTLKRIVSKYILYTLYSYPVYRIMQSILLMSVT